MYFSQAFAVDRAEADDWFDQILNVDTPLFVDPFLIFAESDGPWSDCDDVLSGHFQRGFEILAGHHLRPASIQYRKTVDLMIFPEPAELGLGYVGEGTDGSGTGIGFAERIVKAMSLAIEAGLADLQRFEELGVLVERIGRDRISDITCNIMKSRLISYTQDVCLRHGIPTETFSVTNAAFDEQRMRWAAADVELPRNPLKDAPIILIPRRFLRELPTLNADDWWEYVEPTLRDDLNWDTSRKLSKKEIVHLARQHPDWVREWTTSRSGDEPEPYDVDRDPAGLHNWLVLGQEAESADPINDDEATLTDMDGFVRVVNEKFRHFIEERGGWELLHNDDTGRPKREASIQLLYRGVVESYCQARGVRLDREINLGRGPVDFAFTGEKRRILMEIKKLRNGEFWNGLENQLTSYLTSEECDTGWFLAVRFTDSKTESIRQASLRRRTADASAATNFLLRSMTVDARRPVSASNITGTDDRTGAVEDPEFPEIGSAGE